MPRRINPFLELYVAEIIRPDSFPDIFSPLLMNDVIQLFQPGNVVLIGVQGTGKSMLLSLLKPDIRLGYLKRGPSARFPIQREFARFIGAGISLTKSGAVDFGQRPINTDTMKDLVELPSFFADFVNYWIVDDMLQSIEAVQCEADGALAAELGVSRARKRLDSFAKRVATAPCWVGNLDGVHSYKELRSTIVRRITQYRKFMTFSGDCRVRLPKEVRDTKTSIGEPISQVAAELWRSQVVPDTVPFFIRVDDYQELSSLEDWSQQQGLYLNYRQVINKLLGRRDNRVSYKIGTRPYAWRTTEDAQMYGTTAALEVLRNYIEIPLDEILRRRESTKNWKFRKFANDVFRKRLKAAGYSVQENDYTNVRKVFGGTRLDAEETATIYAGNAPLRALDIDPKWLHGTKRVLYSLAERGEILKAKLGEAWVRQRARTDDRVSVDIEAPSWLEYSKRWWRKERINQALLQIAARRGQKMIWARESDIMNLSGSCILAFLNMCQHIWLSWLRSLPPDKLDDSDTKLPLIKDVYIQTEGIEAASAEWYRKMDRFPDGASRQRFVDYIGKRFRSILRSDKRMSYPGSNGFSLSLAELERDKEVASFLQDAVAYGALVERRHTPKLKGQGERKKWYLNPILSPYYQIPAAHTKEPLYVNAVEVRQWLVEARSLPHDTRRSARGLETKAANGGDTGHL